MRISYAVAMATLLFSPSALAQVKLYGQAGTFEVAGNFSFGSQTSDYDDAGKQTTAFTTISPSGGFFLMDAVQILGDVRVTNATTEFEGGGERTSQELSIGVGAGYFIGIGAIRVGPQMLLRYYSLTIEQGSAEQSDTGPGVSIGAALKVPIGSGGLVIAGLNYDYLTTSRKEPKDEGTVSGYATTVGFGIYF